MTSTVIESLLSRTIDYAGMFPPARLSLEDTLANYLEYRKGVDECLLGRLVVPAPSCTSVVQFVNERDSDSGCPLSLIGSAVEAVEWLSSLTGVLRQAQADVADSNVVIEAIEQPLPAGMTATEIDEWSDVTWLALKQRITESFPHPLTVFLEVPAPCWSVVGRRLAERANELSDQQFRLGLKLRTGGLTPGAFPDKQIVAEVIRCCAETGCIWKATAGLHHPLPQQMVEPAVTAHGFLNLFVASVLAECESLSLATITEIVSETEPSAFEFGAGCLSWRDHQASLSEVQAARGRGMLSFGSCSFVEPRDELKELGWWVAPGNVRS